MSGYTNFHHWVATEAGYILVNGLQRLITGIYLTNEVRYIPNSDVLVVQTLIGELCRDERDEVSKSADWDDLWQRYLAARTQGEPMHTAPKGIAHVH